MKKIFILLLSAILYGCSQPMQNHIVTDVTKEQLITLSKSKSNKTINRMKVHVTGYIDGEAQIYIILNDKPYKTEEISGDVNFKWTGDWYSDIMEIKYKPSSVNGGKLNLQYLFE
jgi:hypothetical protein